MARDHCRISLDIWDDEDWTELTHGEQMAYITLISSKDLSYCGVMPYLPQRFTLAATDWTERKALKAIEGLERGRFVIVDRTTAELLVRSYVRHDGLIKQPNVTKSLVRAYHKVHSTALRVAIEWELHRLYGRDPDAKGWGGMAESSPELFERVVEGANGNPWANPSAKGSRNPSPNPSAKGSAKGRATPLPPSPFPLSSSSLRDVTREAASR